MAKSFSEFAATFLIPLVLTLKSEIERIACMDIPPQNQILAPFAIDCQIVVILMQKHFYDFLSTQVGVKIVQNIFHVFSTLVSNHFDLFFTVGLLQARLYG